jgi:hypothetical protein
VRIDPKSLVAPAIAAFVLILAVQQTMSALKSSGAWRAVRQPTGARPPDPYATVDAILSRPLAEYPTERQRDPFGYAAAPVAVVTPPSGGSRVRRQVTVPLPPPVPARPVLTAIIFDADPRATIRFNSRDFSVRENSLFADYRVKSITASQVVLESNKGEALVLILRPKGD